MVDCLRSQVLVTYVFRGTGEGSNGGQKVSEIKKREKNSIEDEKLKKLAIPGHFLEFFYWYN